MSMKFHDSLVGVILETQDEYHTSRVVERMRDITPELDRLSIPAFIALCEQANREVSYAA